MKGIVIEFKGKPIMVVREIEFKDSREFIVKQNECQNNMRELLQDQEKQEKKIVELESNQIKMNAQIRYLSGEITEQECNEICGLKV